MSTLRKRESLRNVISFLSILIIPRLRGDGSMPHQMLWSADEHSTFLSGAKREKAKKKNTTTINHIQMGGRGPIDLSFETVNHFVQTTSRQHTPSQSAQQRWTRKMNAKKNIKYCRAIKHQHKSVLNERHCFISKSTRISSFIVECNLSYSHRMSHIALSDWWWLLLGC